VGDRTVNKSVNISVNNLLMKNTNNKSGLISSHQKVEKRAMIIDIKQLLEQRGSKCTCKIVPRQSRSVSQGAHNPNRMAPDN
jgi:hypothetical protein